MPKCPIRNKFGADAGLENTWKDAHVFLVLGGPSLKTMPIDQLSRRGIITLAVNNVAAFVRPTMWTFGDTSGKFHDTIWEDPGIIKFVPDPKLTQHLRSKVDGTLTQTTRRPIDCPGIFGIYRNTVFRPDEWLHEDTFNWGHGNDGLIHYATDWMEANNISTSNSGKAVEALQNAIKDGTLTPEQTRLYRPFQKTLSTMVQALRLCYYLGFRVVYLLGCDFTMSPSFAYAFDEQRPEGAAAGNMHSYSVLATFFESLRPKFDEAHFQVFNCNQNSALWVFDYISFDDALAWACERIPDTIDTLGWYEKEDKKK